uniref:Uncharacterized protein n=1 Tax=Rhizophora mucronata TaxID=61149 RepID=A0A2P2QUS8_RHIMU
MACMSFCVSVCAWRLSHYEVLVNQRVCFLH